MTVRVDRELVERSKHEALSVVPSATEQSVALFYCFGPVAKLRPDPNAAILGSDPSALECSYEQGRRCVCCNL